MKFLKTVLNRPKFQLFPVKFPVNREFPPVTGSLKTASTTTQSFEFIGKGIESERPKLSSGFRAMMQSFLSKTPNSMHYSARSPQKFLLRLLKWDLEAGYWCTILFRFEHSPPLSLQKTANERGGGSAVLSKVYWIMGCLRSMVIGIMVWLLWLRVATLNSRFLFASTSAWNVLGSHRSVRPI